MTARKWICSKYGMNEADNFGVNYRIIEDRPLVETISIDKAVEIFNRDLEEMRVFLGQYGHKDKAFEATCKIWDKHLVVF